MPPLSCGVRLPYAKVADLIGGHAEHPPGRGVEHSLKQLAAELQTEVSKFSV